MIDYFFGKPRTGKTYRAMKLIHDLYISPKKDETPKFKNILTNVGGFKFQEINQIFLNSGSSSVAYKLKWSEFYKHLKKMYEMAIDDKSDEELNRYADYHKINDCLIVIDEASYHFKKYDDVLSWWLAYHGHFRIRIILIAQSPKQINSEYLVHTEIYYDAQSQSKQLTNNKLRYIHYSDIPFNKENKFSSDTITTSQDIYDLYKSGEIDKPKKIIYKYIFIAIASLVSIVFLFNLFLNNLNDRTITPGEENLVQNSENNNISINNEVGKIFLNIRCNEKNCWNVDKKYLNNSISLNYFKYVVIKYQLELNFEEIKNEIYTLKPFENTLSKVTLAKLTDYYYYIPVELKTKELSTLFQLAEPDIKTSIFDGTFDSQSEISEDLTSA